MRKLTKSELVLLSATGACLGWMVGMSTGEVSVAVVAGGIAAFAGLIGGAKKNGEAASIAPNAIAALFLFVLTLTVFATGGLWCRVTTCLPGTTALLATASVEDRAAAATPAFHGAPDAGTCSRLFRAEALADSIYRERLATADFGWTTENLVNSASSQGLREAARAYCGFAGGQVPR